jgi:hypothetical protein
VTATPDERWDQWCSDFDEVVREMTTLFHTRWMWRNLIKLMESATPQYTVVQGYFVRTYITTMCTALRREADRDSRTTSLARCLGQLKERPFIATRARYEAIIEARDDIADPELRESVKSGFDRFSGPGDAVDENIVDSALARLSEAVAPIKTYTDKVVAHRERWPGDTERISVSFPEINTALEVVGDITKQFYRLRWPGTELLRLTPVTELNFLRMFEKPWYTDSFRPASDDDDAPS